MATTDGAQLESPPELPAWMAAIARIAPASAWRMLVQRLIATAVDLVGLIAVVGALGAAMKSDSLRSGPRVLTYVASGVLVAFLSTQLIWLMRHGATIGKRISGVRIVRRDGSAAGVGRIVFLRYLPAVLAFSGALQTQIPLLAVLLLIVDAAFVLRPQQRSFRDWLSNTAVIASRWSYSNRAAHGALSGGEPPR